MNTRSTNCTHQTNRATDVRAHDSSSWHCWSTQETVKAPLPADAHPEFNGDPFRFGSRVPCLVLSPYAKPGHVSAQLNSHVSLVTFCQTIFGLPPLNHRNSASNGMSDCFDFTQLPLPAG